jgi:uncharacterized protein
MTITPTYAGLLALLFIALSLRVIGARREAGIALGDGGDRGLQRRQRVHANFAEYVPFALILMFLTEQGGAPTPIIHGIGLMLLVGRTIHAVGVSGDPERMAMRVVGMGLTFAALGTGALVNLTGAIHLAALLAR